MATPADYYTSATLWSVVGALAGIPVGMCIQKIRDARERLRGKD